jgi:hypothetical protein
MLDVASTIAPRVGKTLEWARNRIGRRTGMRRGNRVRVGARPGHWARRRVGMGHGFRPWRGDRVSGACGRRPAPAQGSSVCTTGTRERFRTPDRERRGPGLRFLRGGGAGTLLPPRGATISASAAPAKPPIKKETTVAEGDVSSRIGGSPTLHSGPRRHRTIRSVGADGGGMAERAWCAAPCGHPLAARWSKIGASLVERSCASLRSPEHAYL